jgi:hypothetical protein
MDKFEYEPPRLPLEGRLGESDLPWLDLCKLAYMHACVLRLERVGVGI